MSDARREAWAALAGAEGAAPTTAALRARLARGAWLECGERAALYDEAAATIGRLEATVVALAAQRREYEGALARHARERESERGQMSDGRHTPGRLGVNKYGMLFAREQPGDMYVPVADVRRDEPTEAKANAARIAACWNACQGIPTDALEDAAGRPGAGRLETLAGYAGVAAKMVDPVPAVEGKGGILRKLAALDGHVGRLDISPLTPLIDALLDACRHTVAICACDDGTSLFGWPAPCPRCSKARKAIALAVAEGAQP